MSNIKDSRKAGGSSSSYSADNNSAIIVVKWINNNIVQLFSNFVGIYPMTAVDK